MRLRPTLLFLLGTVLAAAGTPARADTPAATVTADPADGDVTMTVIPSGEDVVKTVVQNIVVPANANKAAKGKNVDQSGPQRLPAAGQHAAAEQTLGQVAIATAQHQATQTQQQTQQAQQQVNTAAGVVKPAPPPGGGG